MIRFLINKYILKRMELILYFDISKLFIWKGNFELFISKFNSKFLDADC